MTEAERIAQLEARVQELERFVGQLRSVFSGSGGGGVSAQTAPATDHELDGQYGDPDVAFLPRAYTAGGVVKKQKYSRCPPAFLEILAEAYDQFAERSDREGNKDSKGKPKSGWDRKNARLARGWARRITTGWKPPPPPSFGGAATTPLGTPSANPWGTRSSGWGTTSSAPEPNPVEETPLPSDEDGDFLFGHNVTTPLSAPNATPPLASPQHAPEDFDDDPPL